MYILGKNWNDGHLDYHRSAGEARIATRAWWSLRHLDDVYVRQPRSLRRVWNYYREVGLAAVISKVRSRLAESVRDRRVIAVGIGQVIEGAADCGLEDGAPVVFVAPCHPECVQRPVLPRECLAPVEKEIYDRFVHGDGIDLFDVPAEEELPPWTEVAGWNRFSGSELGSEVEPILAWAKQRFSEVDSTLARRLSIPRESAVAERVGTPSGTEADLRAVIFGLGHYAKINVLPNLDPRIRVECIHEVDPTQLPIRRDPAIVYDTCETVRPREQYDVYLLPGYHHTHADLAVHALNNQAHAVVEKPLVTTREQLDRLTDAIRRHPGKLFACFHMRYNPLWDLARKDLALAEGQPVHYHCIVYEIPLPRRHWYNWENSGSRLISNGCHWLDHFLSMNGYAEATRRDLWKGGNGDLHVSVELANGAVFGMCLTEMGSQRIGVQEHIELRANGGTVVVDNGASYRAENTQRIIRTKQINKYSLYKRMYHSICRKILSGEPGDSAESVQRCCGLVLDLEEMYQQL